ncbi:galactokinase [Alkalihalophilus sp. As8PL]|uniref:Galactokinase n=1 Tax=Alkalihalophilus sp. As8PL TaxID=3237103 RepID=A0AB39BWZ4_9BACI
MKYEELVVEYEKLFHSKNVRVFFAPGRINLIGEHTDYNGGNVFPCAITYGTYALANKRSDRKVRLYSTNFPAEGVIEFDLDSLDYDERHDWANYPKGMLKYMKENHEIGSGMDVLFYGNIPNGAGLSSSASIELVTGAMLESLFDLELDRLDLVKIGMRVENEFIGVNSGIMDQFAIGMGKKEHGILLDCQTLQFKYAKLNLENRKILIINTNKRRELAESKYNERRSECMQALADIQNVLNIDSLGQLTEQQFEEVSSVIEDETIKKRAKHAVYENQRTIKALEALKHQDLKKFGELMNDSHRSLQFDYEVTGIELDTLVSAAWEQVGVLGARMTGAGFGGCAIAIVEEEHIEAFIENVSKIYEEKIGYEATFYIASIGDGAREVKEGVHI